MLRPGRGRARGRFRLPACGGQGKLSTKFSDVSNLLREANYWVAGGRKGRDGRPRVAGAPCEDHAEQPDRGPDADLAAKGPHRRDRWGQVGQVNGLAVYDMGDYSFGKPSRITATVYAEKAGPEHRARNEALREDPRKGGPDPHKLPRSSIARKAPSASSPRSPSSSCTDDRGDSATCAELYALLSALSGVPVRQGIA